MYVYFYNDTITVYDVDYKALSFDYVEVNIPKDKSLKAKRTLVEKAKGRFKWIMQNEC